MARGAQSKEIITQKILEIFPGSFLYNGNKEIRIPMIESGENIQIKINLVCAKENVINDAAKVNVENAASEVSSAASPVQTNGTAAPAMVSPTDSEKARVKELLEKLNL